ncbi:M23 family metallopeptidase [Rossellomorea marisflavi]|uniref:M23 family metallopeptidase n=1 Tax=Rossellomorea marisflavi TaxID=189381 RepID=UPI003459C938
MKLGLPSSPFPSLKRAGAIALVLGAFATASSASAAEDFKTVYHVYMGSEYVGAVTDKAEVDAVLEKKLSKAMDEHKDIDLDFNKEVTYIPEDVFTIESQDQDVLNTIQKSISVEANAYAVEVDGEPVAYVKDEKDAEDVLKAFKLNHVSKKELEDYENRKDDESLAELEENESRILDLSFKEQVETKEAKVDPDEVVSVKEAAKDLESGKVEEKDYKVERGDSLGEIAKDHDLSMDDILDLNKDVKADEALKVGEKLVIKDSEPFLHMVVKKEVNKLEAIDYEKKVKDDASMTKGDTKVEQAGKEGEKSVTYEVTEENGAVESKDVKDEETLKKPVDYIVLKGTKEIPGRGNGNFVWPTNGGYISSKQGERWGKFHKGIDIARPTDHTIKTVDNGVVESAGWNDGGYGNKIVIDHQNGYKTIYGHLASISVKAGQKVEQGQKIGVMGDTGQSTGVHLHIEVYKDGKMLNPLDVLHQ